MPRRDAFSGLRDNSSDFDAEKDQQRTITISPDVKFSSQPLDLIPTADLRKKRTRNWEKAHRSETATYRGVPRQTVERIIKISQSLSVPRDEVVRAFLEYGVSLYRNGQLAFVAYPKAQHMTLFPVNEKVNQPLPLPTAETENWLKNAFPTPIKKTGDTKNKKHKKNPEEISQWEMRVTYRIPVMLKEELRSIAGEHTLPVGEVVRFFIEKGSMAFYEGSLKLKPFPKMISKTLFLESD